MKSQGLMSSMLEGIQKGSSHNTLSYDTSGDEYSISIEEGASNHEEFMKRMEDEMGKSGRHSNNGMGNNNSVSNLGSQLDVTGADLDDGGSHDGASGDKDFTEVAAEEELRITKAESKYVRRSRYVVLSILALAGIGMALTMYSISKDNEVDKFESHVSFFYKIENKQ